MPRQQNTDCSASCLAGCQCSSRQPSPHALCYDPAAACCSALSTATSSAMHLCPLWTTRLAVRALSLHLGGCQVRHLYLSLTRPTEAAPVRTMLLLVQIHKPLGWLGPDSHGRMQPAHCICKPKPCNLPMQPRHECPNATPTPVLSVLS